MKVVIDKIMIPYIGNKRSEPYGTIKIIDGKKSYIRKFDLSTVNKYIINGIKYELKYTGKMYSPSFYLEVVKY